MLLLGCADAAVLMLAAEFSLRLRYLTDARSYAMFAEHFFLRAATFSGTVVLCMFALGLYQAQIRERRSLVLLHQSISFAFATVLLVMIYYFVPQIYIGRGVLGVALGLGALGVIATHLLLGKFIGGDLLKRRVLVLGAGDGAALIAECLRVSSSWHTFSIVGFAPSVGELIKPHCNLIDFGGQRVCDWACEHRIDEIVVALDERRGTLSMTELLECKQRGILVTGMTHFLERESGKVKLDVRPSSLVFSDGFQSSSLRMLAKRIFDVGCALSLVALSWPLMLIIALAIRLESSAGSPVLYRQERVGEHGRVFVLYKFRSMRTDAEAAGVRWASSDDPRVTAVGRLIRKMRLDELPQLWNVLRGNMSMVGPRPERPHFVAEFTTSIPYYDLRHCIKPGLTGWAQLRCPYGASAKDAAEKLTFDLFYVKNHTFLFDTFIFIQTVEVVLFGRGAR